MIPSIPPWVFIVVGVVWLLLLVVVWAACAMAGRADDMAARAREERRS